MNKNPDGRGVFGAAVTVALLVFAVWLVWPFAAFESSDAVRAREYGFRLALGLMILILFVGKGFFDVLAPQGLARKVSNIKAVALMVLSIGILVFVVFIIGRAVSLYLGASWSETTLDY